MTNQDIKVGDKVKTKFNEQGKVRKIYHNGDIDVVLPQTMMGRQCVVVRSKKDLVSPGRGVAY